MKFLNFKMLNLALCNSSIVYLKVLLIIEHYQLLEGLFLLFYNYSFLQTILLTTPV